ncbi:MAG: ankyrin repeat domain-containing protein [Verrucomicrobia bacterium]|nr:ankyrin repeat domain-containing protein [Verrucomicrobiota bacterium]
MDINEQLFTALMKKDFAAATAAIQAGAEINGRTKLGEGVWSFVTGDTASVRMALGMDADPNVRDGADRTSLYWAVHQSDPEVAKVLIESGANVADIESDGTTLLHWAAMSGFADVLAVLLAVAPGYLLQARDILDHTALDEAIAAKHETCVQIIRAELGRRGNKGE